jgi:polyhydroxybutyrate depolymerase
MKHLFTGFTLMRRLRIALIVLGAIAALIGGLYVYFLYAPSLEPPQLAATFQRSTIRVGELERTYAFFVPEQLPEKSALLFVLHGSTQNAEDIRLFTGYEFERLATANGLIVVYPEGYAKNWNDCRKSAPYEAKALDINDVAFLHALIDQFRRDFIIDRTRVFAVGYSSGGQMVYRLALESRSEISAIAAIGASLPTADNSDCHEPRQPLPVLIMNGTADPISPFEGGEVSFFGFRSRGTVRSSIETARYFARMAGHDIEPTEINHQTPEPPYVKQQVWQSAGKAEVVLYSVIGGGHVIPQPHYRAPRFLGPTVTALNGPAEIWKFFARHPLTTVPNLPAKMKATAINAL